MDWRWGQTQVDDFDTLRQQATRAAGQAYAPYSGLRVGAALRSGNGQIHCGCNVENAAFPIGGCAERAAIAAAVLAEGPGLRIDKIAIVALAANDAVLPVPPCGACRQALVEFGAETQVGFHATGGQWIVTTAGALLPHGFALPERE